MSMTQNNISVALSRLNSHLPLKQRQRRLPPVLRDIHRLVLCTLADQGRPPTQAELITVLASKKEVRAGLQTLGLADLIVLDRVGDMPVGAYPLTIEETPHRVTVNGHSIYAMCALDAVSVAPMFATDVVIESVCQVSNISIKIHMHDSQVLKIHPDQEVRIGIRWQMPSSVAAHSMCTQMVFLKNLQTALAWQDGDVENVSIITLQEAIEIGKGFFLPLLV